MTPVRIMLVFGTCLLFVAAGKHLPTLKFLFGWWACCSWMLITKQWKPFA